MPLMRRILLALVATWFWTVVPGPAPSLAGGEPAPDDEPALRAVEEIRLNRGTTTIPLVLPDGADLAHASRDNRPVAILLISIRTDRPVEGAFRIVWPRDGSLIGMFNTFSLVSKSAGEDRVIPLAEKRKILSGLAASSEGARIQIVAPEKYAGGATVGGAELLIE